MRYLFGFLCVCALGLVPLVGCGEAAKCQSDTDCDVVECMYGKCVDGLCTEGTGYYYVVEDGTPCQSDGTTGVCLCALCKVGPIECSTREECDDGNECTKDYCDCTGSCGFGAEDRLCCPCDLNGVPGVCRHGVCVEECSIDEECDDGLLCTNERCTPQSNWEFTCECQLCSNPPKCHDDNRCTDDMCDPDTGCYYPNAPDGTWCGCGSWGPGDCPPLTFDCPSICAGSRGCRNGECI
jgi:hypothetical protein